MAGAGSRDGGVRSVGFRRIRTHGSRGVLFSSFSFLPFLAVALVAARWQWSWRGRKAVLLVMSYLFYATWHPPFVLLLWFSTACDWWIARAIHRREDPVQRWRLLMLSVFINLGLLGFFKYASFFVQSAAVVARPLGLSLGSEHFSVVLPIGISFYTFQTLSYSIDVYRRRIEPSRSLIDYALFVTFFPQLVAGPVVRARDFLPQCARPPICTPEQLSSGMSLLIYGLFIKVVLANAILAPIVETVFDSSEPVGASGAWAGVLAFAVQVLFDFEGYSACAIGIARCLGFELRENFRFPYGAVGFQEFWRRWHISLSTWLRDYLYIPLGGSREKGWRTDRNLMVTMLLSGLWHGASWRFVVWGGLHGVYLIAERRLQRRIGHWPCWRSPMVSLGLTFLTFLLFAVALLLFRGQSFEAAWQLLLQLLALQKGAGLRAGMLSTALWVSAVTVIAHRATRDRSVDEVWAALPETPRAAVMAGMILSTLYCMTSGDDLVFVYFQF